jgi:hypothetical protein
MGQSPSPDSGDEILVSITGDADSLLREWFDWWTKDADAPVKLPNALHVRTAMYLTPRDGETE